MVQRELNNRGNFHLSLQPIPGSQDPDQVLLRKWFSEFCVGPCLPWGRADSKSKIGYCLHAETGIPGLINHHLGGLFSI